MRQLDEDMANIGRALMERLPKGYHWNDCPTEIVTDLLNQIHDLKRLLPVQAKVEPRSSSLPRLEFNEHCGCCVRNKVTVEVFTTVCGYLGQSYKDGTQG